MRLNDPELVRRQYATEAGLAVRRGAAVPRPLPEPAVPFRSRTVNSVFVAEKAA